MDYGLWTLDFGLWIMDFGLWTLDFGLWTLDYGHRYGVLKNVLVTVLTVATRIVEAALPRVK